MAEVTVAQAVPLKGVPNVELVAVGSWKASTGPVTITVDDLASAVAALDCPGVHNPVIKLGHEEPDPDARKVRWDGEPAVGWISNMRLSANRAKILGDYTGMPAWLADVLPSAYPQRSVEIQHDFVCQIGHTHPFVITAVSLLGVMPPAVGVIRSLNDVQALYTLAAPPPVTGGQGSTLTLAAGERGPLRREPTTVELAASTDFERLQQQWRTSLDGLVVAYGAASAGQRAEIEQQIQQAVDGGNLAALAAITVGTAATAALIAAALRITALDAFDDMLAEAARQGVAGNADDRAVDLDWLAKVADGVAAAMGASTAATAGRNAVQLAAPGVPGRDIADRVGDILTMLPDRFWRDQLGGALSTAQNTGRLAALTELPAADIYASEILDQATCQSCRAVDGIRFSSLADARAAYGAGGFAGCQGGPRCRGTVVAVWTTALAATVESLALSGSTLRFDPGQRRDADGKWTDGAGGEAGAVVKDTAGWTPVGPQQGSNPGGTYRAPNGQLYYVKQRTQLQAENEALAAALYEKTGVRVPEVSLATNVLGKSGAVGIASKIEKGKRNLRQRRDDPDYQQKIYDGFVVDAWLANWDTVGLEYDNIIEQDGDPLRVDVGGSLLYRAQGGPKGDKFGDTVGELETLRDPKMNPQAAQVFKDIDLTDGQQMGPAVKRVLDVSDEDIDGLVDAYVSDEDANDRLKSTLKARREDIRDQLGHLTEDDAPAKVALGLRVGGRVLMGSVHLHLPGGHDQRSHGNKRSRVDQGTPTLNIPGKTGLARLCALAIDVEIERHAARTKAELEEHAAAIEKKAAQITKKWKGKPAPKAPAQPVPPQNDPTRHFDGWLAKVNDRYNALNTGKPLEKSYNYSYVKTAIEKPGTVDGNKAILFLKANKYIDDDLQKEYVEAYGRSIEAEKVGGVNSPEYKKALTAHKRATTRHKRDMAQWREVNGVTGNLSGMDGALVHTANEDGIAWAKAAFPKPDDSAAASALMKYTGSAYHSWNAALRKAKGQAPDGWETETKNADAGMTEFTEPVMLVRGTNFDEFAFPDGKRTTNLPPPDPMSLIGSVQVQHGYMSTSVGTSPGYGGSQVRMRVRVPAGHKGAYVSGFAGNASEREMLLQRSTAVFIHDVYLNKDGPFGVPQWVVEAEVLPPGVDADALIGHAPMPMASKG